MGQAWIVLRGLLCSRPTLLQMLTLDREPHPPSDAELVLTAYQRFGLDCVQHLAGDWAFALWDGQLERLILAKDPTGNCAWYWWRGPSGQTLFSNNLPTLMAAGQVPARPDQAWVAGLVTIFYDPARPTATAFSDVHALPPGQLLQVSRGQAELVHWWNPLALPRLDAEPREALEARFLTLYEDAVVQRLARSHGSVAATLSGGLDSGSVVALAAPALARQDLRLRAFVHVPRLAAGGDCNGRTANEWDLAVATAEHVGNVDPQACPTAHISPVQAIDWWLDLMAVPSHAAAHWFWGLDIVQQAAAGGAEVVLSGEGGNSTVSYSGDGNLWRRVHELKLGLVSSEVVQEIGGWGRGIRNRLVKPALRPAWHACKRWREDWARGKDTAGWMAFGLLRPEVAAQLALVPAMRAARHDPALRQFSPFRARKWRLGMLSGGDNTFAVGHALGIAHGLEWRDPTKDRRLVELCWQLPDEIFWAHGQHRGLIRHGMRDRLPSQVLDCRAKGLQSSDLRQRLVECSGALMDTVSAVSRNPTVREWFDIERLQTSARAAIKIQKPNEVGAVSPDHLMRALAAAAFVARHA